MQRRGIGNMTGAGATVTRRMRRNPVAIMNESIRGIISTISMAGGMVLKNNPPLLYSGSIWLPLIEYNYMKSSKKVKMGLLYSSILFTVMKE